MSFSVFSHIVDYYRLDPKTPYYTIICPDIKDVVDRINASFQELPSDIRINIREVNVWRKSIDV